MWRTRFSCNGPVRAGRSPDEQQLRMSRCGERGVALVITLLALVLLATFGMSLVLTTTTETMIAAGYRDSIEALYAAEAGMERAIPDLRPLLDWNAVLWSADGLHSAAPSSFMGSTLTPTLPGGRTIDLRKATNALNCPQVVPTPVTACSGGSVAETTRERPWGANNPHWRLYAHGALADLLPGRIDSPFYVIVWVADDGAETDNDPARDGGPGQVDIDGDGWPDASNPGVGIIQVHAEALGPAGARSAIEATLARAERQAAAEGGEGAGVSADSQDGVEQTGLRVLSWRQLR